MTYTGKVAWITGASSGIGAALAREWSARGTDIILSGRDETRLAEVASQLQTDAMIDPFDVRDEATLADPTGHAIAWKGGGDIAVANARISQRSRALNSPTADGSTRGRSDKVIEGDIAANEAARTIIDACEAGQREIIIARGMKTAPGEARRTSDGLFDQVAGMVASGYMETLEADR